MASSGSHNGDAETESDKFEGSKIDRHGFLQDSNCSSDR